MARWLKGDGVPPELGSYDPDAWAGDIGAWKTAALAWLADNPGRFLPFVGEFGDEIDVFRVAREVRLASELGVRERRLRWQRSSTARAISACGAL
jgi:hypothetical protein